MSIDALISGLLHPLLVPSHALALLALGLLIGRQNRRIACSVVFAIALAGGLVALAQAFTPTQAGSVVLATGALNGLLLALAFPIPTPVCMLLVAIAGAALGLDSPPHVISLTTATLMLVGTEIGACMVLAVVTACAARLTREWERIGVRIVGSWIAASSILVLALRYARGLLF
jgi:hydrogenase/urease accessory protein HupE